MFRRSASALSGIIEDVFIQRLDLTLPTPEENLACDEVLLDFLQEGQGSEILRFWQPSTHFVVLGYGNSLEQNVRADACRLAKVPILRRCSGGGTVLQGPGCLNYALILRASSAAPLQTICQTNCFILDRFRQALEPLLGGTVTTQGETDLALGPLKISGNCQRRKRDVLLFHGTLLLDMDLTLMEQLLPQPARRPAYRQDRPHREFLHNTHLDPKKVRQALSAEWNCRTTLNRFPEERIRALARERYASEEWTRRL